MNRFKSTGALPEADSKASIVNNTSADITARQRSNNQRAQNTLLIWLDNNIDESSEDCRNTITQLQRVLNDIETFIDGDSCVDYLETIDKTKVCLIVSGSLGQYIVPHVHSMLQVDSIFIFCTDQKRHEQWVKKWPKVKGLSDDVVLICEMVKQIARQVEQNAMSMSFVASDRRVDQLNPTFMYTQIFKEIILTIPFDSTHRQEYIQYCRKLFATNSTEMARVKQLEHTYHKGKAIWWYTHHCFLYPMLNRALYLMDGDTITKMGFFIKDLHEHIEQLHLEQFAYESSPKIFTVYRGQGLAKGDFEQMQKSEGGLISFNNFLSTSRDRQTAFHFAMDAVANPDLMAVLFIMEINPIRSTTPFASITDVSDHQNENEVLFSMHSVFRINSIQPMSGDNRFHEVHLTLTSDNDPKLFELSCYMRRESHPGTEAWYRLGSLLLRMGQSQKAEEIYETLLRRTADDNERAPIYDCLGLAKFNQGKYQEAITCCTKLLAIYQQSPFPEPLRLANISNRMGSAYLSMGNCVGALKAHQDALRTLRQSVSEDHPDLAKSYNNIGLTQYSMSDYAKALFFYQKALAISQQILPPNHPDLASLYNNIGSVYQSMGDFEKALSYYEKDLATSQQSLPPNHPDLAKSFNNIGSVYRYMGDYAKALSSHEKALAIYKRVLQAGHPDFAVCYDYIGNVYRSMGDLKKALSYHQNALAINEQSLPSNHPSLASSHNNIGNVYCSMGKYDKALASHETALAIRQQSLATNHPDIGSSYSNIAAVYENMRNYTKARLFYERAVRSAEHSLYPIQSNLELHKKNMARVKRKC